MLHKFTKNATVSLIIQTAPRGGILYNIYILYIYVPWSKVAILGMGNLPPFIRNPYNGYIHPYYWVEFPIPHYMEIIGV